MKRFRLKADGRIVELRDGKEFPLVPEMEPAAAVQPGVRDLRRRAQLTQIEFASRLGVPVVRAMQRESMQLILDRMEQLRVAGIRRHTV